MLAHLTDDVIHDDDSPLKAEVVKKAFRGAEFLYTLRLGDGKEILSLPTMHVTKLAEEQKDKKKAGIKSYDPSVLNKVVKIYFDAGKSELDQKYQSDLDQILTVLGKYGELGVEISGYASAEGDEAFNEKLSNKRATSVLDYINTRGVVRRRIVAKGYGATKDQSSSKEEARRVEIRVIDLSEI